jgi:hypothetical protein
MNQLDARVTQRHEDSFLIQHERGKRAAAKNKAVEFSPRAPTRAGDVLCVDVDDPEDRHPGVFFSFFFFEKDPLKGKKKPIRPKIKDEGN